MPETLHLRGDRAGDLYRAAEILRAGGLVAFPTETVYGLGGNALSAEAVAGIFMAKGRPAWDPLIVHLPVFEAVATLAVMDEALELRVKRLAAAFWPGPLTLLLPKSPCVPDAVTAGRDLVGIRVPSHPVARALLERAGVPLAAPSANRFGHISPTTAKHVLDDLDGRIDAVLDGGPTTVGLESTVLDPTRTPMLVYRAGAITPEMIEEATGLSAFAYVAREAEGAAPASMPSPGVGIRHYAPEARLILSGPGAASLGAEIEPLRGESGSVGVLLPRDWSLSRSPLLQIQPWGTWYDEVSLAAELFSGLRALEAAGVEVIVCPLPPPGGLRDALRDRLLKAARPR